MKNLCTFILILVCFNILPFFSQAQKSRDPVIILKPVKGQQPPDSIHVLYLKGSINGSSQNREVIKINRAGQDGSFKFSFSGIQPISPFTIIVWYGKTTQNSKTFYAEPYDNIRIILNKGTDTSVFRLGNVGKLLFSGKGANKYKIADQLTDISYELWKSELPIYNKQFGEIVKVNDSFSSASYCKSPSFENYLNSLFIRVEIAINKQRSIISRHKNELGQNVSIFYGYELSPFGRFQDYISQLFLRTTNSECRQIIADFYFHKIAAIRPVDPDHKWLRYAIRFRHVRSIDIMFETLYKNNGANFSFNLQYNAIKGIKNVMLREILITNLFEVGSYRKFINKNSSKDSCLNDALNLISNKELRASLNKQLLFNTGNKMYEFKFPDTNGNILSLRDMKGKVFILDFYYYGCGPCILFAQRFEKEVYPEFAKKTDFKILSVNTDKRRETWIKALKTGDYAQRESLKLSTGQAFDHPIFKHYNITSLPWVILINKSGKALSFNLADMTSKEIVGMIKQALKEPDLL